VRLWLALLVLLADPFSAQRERMVREQIEARGVRYPEVLKAMRETPRHLFMPEAVRDLAHEDRPAPIGHNATISQPYIVAWMTELLEPARMHKVLEIGTGSGYQAAVLSPLVRHVYTIEIVPELAKRASETLASLGYRNVTVRAGDGYKGWPEQAPFERIILTAAPPQIPQTLIDQLAPNGRLLAQNLVIIEKNKDGKVRRRSVGGVMFVPMVPAESRR